MWSKGLENKIAKHKVFSKEILDYANSIFVAGFRYTSVNKLSTYLEIQKQVGNKEQKIRKKIPPFFRVKNQ